MANVWPTLGSNGYVWDVPTMMDESFAASLLGRRRDSEIYRGYISSVDEIMRVYAGDPIALAIKLEDMWKTMYTRLFDEVDCSVTAATSPEPGTINYPLTISIQITHEGKRYDLGYEVKYANGASVNLIGVFNGTRKILI